ncbi:MAG: thiamine-phosphate kinase [Ectothiorhodospiraceae bacterium]|jgi:thiamine-monophosphate kinase
MPLSEFELIDRYFRRIGAERADVELGVGDDAAILQPPAGQRLVATVDTLARGVHFPADAPPSSVGHKALAVNLSDLAAMGATPAWATLSLTLPEVDEDWLRGFAQGFDALARRYGVALVGGDTTRGALCISVQAMGFTANPLRRDGAGPGDRVYVTGTLGDAAAGLESWQRAERGTDVEALQERLNRPDPRVALGRRLEGVASACVDVSDGLAADAGHIAERSGVAIRLRGQDIPLSPALSRYVEPNRALRWALTGGDDYELCFTASASAESEVRRAAREAGTAVTAVGTVEAGRGVQIVDAAGQELTDLTQGYHHF